MQRALMDSWWRRIGAAACIGRGFFGYRIGKKLDARPFFVLSACFERRVLSIKIVFAH